MKIRFTALEWGYVVISVALFLYTYTQIDLNLTLARASFVQTVQKSFQYIGYYNRPLSAGIYLLLLGGLFSLYAIALAQVRKGALSLSGVWRIVGIVTVLLVFSYPAAFSYDFFNYLFTAKTVLVYHKNPYAVTPLMFASIDPWTNFMRWTHLPSAYTPLWIVMSLLPYMLGLGYFLLVLYGMKLFIAGFFLLACAGIVRIMTREDPKFVARSLVLFGLNPLVIIETLVSGHNDVVLVAFAMIAIWLLIQKRFWSAWLVLAISVATKLMTIFLIPVFVMKKSRPWMLIAMTAGLVLVLLRREILPWYMVWLWPFIALVPRQASVVFLAGIFSLGLLLTYATYLYVGTYSPWVVETSKWLPYASLCVGIVGLITGKIWFYLHSRPQRSNME